MVAIAIPVCIYELVTVKAEQHVIVWFIAGVFALVAIPLSLHDGTSGKAMCVSVEAEQTLVVTKLRLTCVVLVSGGAHVPLLPARTAASLYSYHSDGAHLRCGVVVCTSVQRLRDCVGVASILVSRAKCLLCSAW